MLAQCILSDQSCSGSLLSVGGSAFFDQVVRFLQVKCGPVMSHVTLAGVRQSSLRLSIH